MLQLRGDQQTRPVPSINDRSYIGCNNHTAIEYTSYSNCSSACGSGKENPMGVDGYIAFMICCKAKARHSLGGRSIVEFVACLLKSSDCW